MRTLMKSVVIAALGSLVMPTWATPFLATLPDSIGPIYGSGGPLSYVMGSVTSPGPTAAGVLTFDLIGYGGIDGGGNQRVNNNDVSDVFTFTDYNGSYFSVSLNMGGAFAGAPVWLAPNPNVTLVSYTDNGRGLGGLAQFKVDFSLLPGDNALVFQYSCCSPSNGTEEGWGLRNVVITADLPTAAPPVNGVPEPSSWALMLFGLVALRSFTPGRKPAPRAAC